MTTQTIMAGMEKTGWISELFGSPRQQHFVASQLWNKSKIQRMSRSPEFKIKDSSEKERKRSDNSVSLDTLSMEYL